MFKTCKDTSFVFFYKFHYLLVAPKRAKKRARNVNEWKRSKIQRLRREGKEYETVKCKSIRERKLKPYEHSCRYDCNKISEEQRLSLFTKFYNMPSYDAQTQYLASCIDKSETKRKNTQATSHKNFSVIVKLLGFRVCKEFFLRTFDISNKRYRTVCLKRNSKCFIERDKRERKQWMKIDAIM